MIEPSQLPVEVPCNQSSLFSVQGEHACKILGDLGGGFPYDSPSHQDRFSQLWPAKTTFLSTKVVILRVKLLLGEMFKFHSQSLSHQMPIWISIESRVLPFAWPKCFTPLTLKKQRSCPRAKRPLQQAGWEGCASP